ncbi:hypothetical protein BXZ70DRAFT_945257 [Cristinia sonorae]|uniref:Structural maintenance of chromosomes protein 5 n=1 Tax=Cristinia sonorae TaxID=1940300 RepID=A0A8K0XN94_9AGAR|nr:hypothetical protein BXZ70DRAFT_945257 [Cristinia sonorae]
MVRRAASSATDDSLKENRSAPSSPVLGKAKAERRESGLRNGRRRVPIDNDEDMQDDGARDDEDDAEGEEDAQGEDDQEEEEEQGRGSPKGRKRARANTNGDSHSSGSKLKAEGARAVTLPRDDDGFIPGSIVRVQLRNFVTYDYVEFSPGPYLNMILGPNGTGKSSIACAICLGLNFPPNLLGRATDLNSFVKLGTTDGHIEIELKGPKGKPNLVIKRLLKATSKSSSFTINGQSASGREVNMKMEELNVQVSNLCSFLPQDRVAEFARMSPQQLLKETQRAAGDENLTAWHETLITAGRDLQTLQGTLEEDNKQLQNLEDRNLNLERDVKRYKERRAVEENIELLEILVPYKEYNEWKAKYATMKELHRASHGRLQALKRANAPVEAFIGNLSRQSEELGRQREAKKDKTKHAFNDMGKKWSESETLEKEAEVLNNKLDSLKTREKKRLADIKALEKQIHRIEEEIASFSKLESTDEVNEFIRALRSEYRHLGPKQEDLQERQRACIAEEARYNDTLKEADRRLTELDDASQRKLLSLRHWDSECADVVAWLRNNQHRFKMEVMEPPMLSVSVSDSKYAQAVESCFSNNQLKMFVMQCDEDYKLFNKLVCDTGEALGRPVRVSTWARPGMQSAPPPASLEKLRGLGFDGYTIDFVKFPEGLLRFLEVDVQLHRIAVGLNPKRIDPNAAMEAFSQSGSARYIIGTTMNNVSRSSYGKKLSQNSTYECRRADKFTNASVDPEYKRRLLADVEAARERLKEAAFKIEELTAEERALRDEGKVFSAKLNELQQRKDNIHREETRRQRMRLNLETSTRRLNDLKNAPPIDVERNTLKAKINDLVNKRVRIISEYEILARKAITGQTDATKLALQSLQFAANLAHFETLCRERKEILLEATAKYTQIRDEYIQIKETAGQKLAISQAKLNEASPETKEKFHGMEMSGEADSKSSEDYMQELENERQKLDLMTGNTNAGVIDQWEQRKAAIEELKLKIADREEKVGKKERAIKAARDKWEPALTKLVDSVGERFSAAFDRIGCAGEIKISQHEDFDKWAIDILVKFRDNEKLQLLTGERQSGGERSLTTIMYLMSLTEEARTPFSLVDEINQGMDARAERAVHNSLVEVTCKADSGQYFLITPKLLPDLMYHERMKVLCVNNGEWLPEDVDRGNMMSMIDNFVRVSRGGGTAAA